MKSVILAGILTVLPLGALAAMSPEETVAAAESAEKTGAFQQAIELYNSFLSANPEHIQRSTVQYRLALCYDNIGQADKAMETFKAVIASPADRGTAKHRSESFLRLAKMQADANQHEAAAATLGALLKEGAGLDEAEAQHLRAGYLAVLGKYEEAALLFSVLRDKPSSPFAKEAAFKLAVVWMKSGNLDLAKGAVEEFVGKYPSHPRAVELFINLAKLHYDKKDAKGAVDICRQVLSDFKEAPEAMEAAFIIALTSRAENKIEEAVQQLEAVGKMPQASHNTVLASEALFEAAQICRTNLLSEERASEFYRLAAVKARDLLTERQQAILEQSLFYEAEAHYRNKRWSAAHDLYMQLRKMGSKLNLLGRILYCQAKMDQYGNAGVGIETEEELNFIRKRISDNPGTLIALQTEVFLLDRKLEKMRMSWGTQVGEWGATQALIDEYAGLFKKYAEDVLKQESLASYIRMRMGGLYAYTDETDPERVSKSQIGLQLLEQAVADAPQALFRVEALEFLAMLASRAQQNKKAFDTYHKLLEITGEEKKDDQVVRRQPSEYIQGMVATASTDSMVEEAIKTVEAVIAKKPADSQEVRDARFYLAELHYMQHRYSDAAKVFKDFVQRYGPPQDTNGNVKANWRKSGSVDEVLDQVYEAGMRVAHCWRTQGHTPNMVNAYRWVTENQNYLNPRIAEAWYMVINTGVDFSKLTTPKKEELARELWTRIVNPSLDAGSKAFKEGFHPWVNDPRAWPYVKVAIMKTGQLLADCGNHRLSALVHQQYCTFFNPGEQQRKGQRHTIHAADEMYDNALYGSGREFLLAGDVEAMIAAFKPYLDGMRDSKFRPSALAMIGHYGGQAERYQDAGEAYAILLDEYGPPNPKNSLGQPVPVPPEKRLHRGGTWNGVRIQSPEKWDVGKIRYGLGFLYWRKEAWDLCAQTMMPFVSAEELRESPVRDESLFMLARSQVNLRQVTAGMKTLEQIVEECPKFKAIDEVYLDIVRVGANSANWQVVDKYDKMFKEKRQGSERRPYIDLYAAISQIGQGRTAVGERALVDLTKSDTYDDLKAEAYYHLARLKLKAQLPDSAGALTLLRKSVDTYPLPHALLETGRSALEQKNFVVARESLDRLVREFPKADKDILDSAQQLRRKVMDAEAGARR
jgi:TolA-binding protein